MDQALKIVSLGQNCEVSFCIEEFTKKPIDSYLFSWAAIYDPLLLIDLYKDLKSLFESEWELTSWGMIRNVRYNIGFHTKMSKRELLTGSEDNKKANYEIALDELKSRLRHLTEKTERLLKNENADPILFVIKVCSMEISDIKYYIESIDGILRNTYRCKNYKLLVMLEGYSLYINLCSKIANDHIIVGYTDWTPASDERKNNRDTKSWMYYLSKASPLTRNITPYITQYEWEFFKREMDGQANGRYLYSEKKLVAFGNYSRNWVWIKQKVAYLNELYGHTITVHLSLSNIDCLNNIEEIGYFQVWYLDSDKKMNCAKIERLSIGNHEYSIELEVSSLYVELYVIIQSFMGCSIGMDKITLTRKD